MINVIHHIRKLTVVYFILHIDKINVKVLIIECKRSKGVVDHYQYPLPKVEKDNVVFFKFMKIKD